MEHLPNIKGLRAKIQWWKKKEHLFRSPAIFSFEVHLDLCSLATFYQAIKKRLLFKGAGALDT